MAILEAIAGVAGGVLDKIFGDDQAKEQAKLQKQFAQHGIRWKVNDAKKAGIHPLYALGANTVSYQPVSVGTDFASMGQNLGRAIDAGRTGVEKGDAFERTAQALTLQKMGLENDLLASQLRTVNQPGHPPTRPGGGATASLASMTGGGGGININVNPSNTPAEDAEAQYGEIGGEIIGGSNFLDDYLRTHIPRAMETGHVTQPVIDAIKQWAVETGNKIYAAPRRSYTPYKAPPRKGRAYTFVP